MKRARDGKAFARAMIIAFVPVIALTIVRLCFRASRTARSFHLGFFDGAPHIDPTSWLPALLLGFVAIALWIGVLLRTLRKTQSSEHFLALTSRGLLRGDENDPATWFFHDHQSLTSVKLANGSLTLHDEQDVDTVLPVSSFALNKTDLATIEQARMRARLGISDGR